MPKKYQRIQKLIELIEQEYDCFWDLCCDHGLIGLGVHSKYPNSKINFVDRVADITNKLKSADIPKYKNIQILTKDILNLKNFGINNLFILSGIGGHLIIEFLSLKFDTPNDFLICTNQNIIQLRQFLASSGYKLIKEEYIHENNQHYEILYISNNSHKYNSTIHPTGDSIWSEYSGNKIAYIDKQIDYLQNILRHKSDKYLEQILSEYKRVKEVLA